METRKRHDRVMTWNMKSGGMCAMLQIMMEVENTKKTPGVVLVSPAVVLVSPAVVVVSTGAADDDVDGYFSFLDV